MSQTLRRFIFFLSVASLLFSLFWQSTSLSLSPSQEDFNDFLSEEQLVLEEHLNALIQSHQSGELKAEVDHWHSLFVKQEYSFFILHDSGLTFWSENETAIDVEELRKDSDFISTGTTMHLKVGKHDKNLLYIALERIATSYPYQNPYLPNQINKGWLPYQEQLNQKLDHGPTQLNWPTQSRENSNSLVGQLLRLLLFLSGSAGIMLAFLSAYRLSTRVRVLLIIAFAFAIRGVFFLFDPIQLQQTILFSPSSFSLSWLLPSTGDLLLHALLLLVISYQLSIWFNELKKPWIFFSSAVIYILGTYFTFYLVTEVVLNSRYSFELENIFKLSAPSYLSLTSFGLFFMSILIWLSVMIKQAASLRSRGLGYAVIGLLYVAFLYWCVQQSELIAEPFLLMPALLIIYLLSIRFRQKSDLLYPFTSIVLISILCNTTIDRLVLNKEASNRELILQKLAEERDPLLEYLFKEVQVEVRSDDSLKRYLNDRWEDPGAYQEYLRKRYFNGYWDRYRMNFTLCEESDSLMVGSNQFSQNCFIYFQDRIYTEGDQISSINLFQLSNMAGRIDYIGEIELNGEENFRLYLELSRDYFSEELGYPELFLNEEDLYLHRKLDEYSNAVYYRGNLINSSGSRIYTTQPFSSNLSDSTIFMYSDGEYENSALRKNENISIVLSQQKVSGVDYMSRITYLLILFGLLYLVLAFNLKRFPYAQRFILTDFSAKIRLLVSASLLMALALFLAGTTYYIKQQYELKNARAMEEKLRSVSLELYQKVADQERLDQEDQAFMANLLIKFSNVFYSDINLYDAEGKLYVSSRPELYQQDLKSSRMHPIAFSNLANLNKSKWVQGESIGKLDFLSAYVPFKNQNNELLAYLNLPYFARQEALEEEIAAFLVPTINIYVIIFTFSLLISFLLINQISKPLLLIRRHISGLRLGGKTELIAWQSEDEIGELVQEYNRIAIELGQSAEELAKTERESAWREMAKQIAHEIKNPLTPMKLSIQHLQRAADSDEAQIRTKIQKTSDTLISQIESLTAIAEAFSTFAKFPDKDLKPLLLQPIANEVAHLYVDQAEVSIQVDQNVKHVEVMADRDLVLRVLNNLIKNSVQAYTDQEKAEIWIRISEPDPANDMIRVEVEDHGKGISQEQAAHIFEPSFTTKSSGTGMGLAIVKRAMEQMGGTVEMRSKVGEGSTFTLYFPKS